MSIPSQLRPDGRVEVRVAEAGNAVSMHLNLAPKNAWPNLQGASCNASARL